MSPSSSVSSSLVSSSTSALSSLLSSFGVVVGLGVVIVIGVVVVLGVIFLSLSVLSSPSLVLSSSSVSSSSTVVVLKTRADASLTEMEAAKQTRQAEIVKDRRDEVAERLLDGQMRWRAIVNRRTVADPAHIQQSTWPMALSCCAG